MEKYIDVIRRFIELLNTVIDGLNHIQKRLNEGYLEETIFLYQDSVMAFAAIENSLNVLPENLLPQDATEFISNVRNAMEIAVTSYEEKNYAKVQAVLQFTLIPNCNRWKRELEESFKSYLVS